MFHGVLLAMERVRPPVARPSQRQVAPPLAGAPADLPRRLRRLGAVPRRFWPPPGSCCSARSPAEVLPRPSPQGLSL
ncbi:MAG: hypothetical protein WKG07_35895 [Hymenobacter sp.]